MHEFVMLCVSDPGTFSEIVFFAEVAKVAQVGGVLILNTVENPKDYLTFFMKIDNAKFKKKVVPGDTIIFKLNLISPIRRGLCHMHGKGFVNGAIVVEADLLAQIAPKE